MRCNDARVTDLRSLCSGCFQAHPEVPIVPIVEQEQHRVADRRKCLRDIGLLHADDTRVGVAHVGEQLISGVLARHLRGCKPAIETKRVIEIEIEGPSDRLGKPVERFGCLDFDVAVDRSLML
jgi:hypothetical protein